VLATASPTESVGQAEVSGEEDPELALLDDGVTPLEERRRILTGARQVVGVEPPIAWILDYVRSRGLKPARALFALKKLLDMQLSGGFRVETREGSHSGYGKVLNMEYVGLFDLGNKPMVKRTSRGQGNSSPVGMGYVKAVASGEGGTEPIKVLGVDFLTPDSVKKTGIVGVGTQMFRIAAEHFKAEPYEGIVGEWYTANFYKKSKDEKDPMSDNLRAYLKGRLDKNLSANEAAKETWTYRRVKEIYAGMEVEVDARELVSDLKNLPPNTQVVEVVFKPKP
jgi:hypothetical protein